MKGMWRRIGWLALSLLFSFVLLGLILRFENFLEKCSIFKVLLEDDHLFHLSLAIIALPVSIVLWCFRTYDNKMSSFLQASGLLGGTPSQQRMAITQLMIIRNKEKVFVPEIDELTQGVFLEKVNLSRMNLNNISLQSSHLINVNFHKSKLQNSSFKNVEGSNINFVKADLRGSDFQGLKVTNLNFSESDSRNVNFKKMDSKGINFYQVDLTDSNFEGAILKESTFSKAILKNSNFTKANLQSSKLHDADLSRTNLTDTSLDGAIYNQHTKFPPEFDSTEIIGRGLIYRHTPS